MLCIARSLDIRWQFFVSSGCGVPVCEERGEAGARHALLLLKPTQATAHVTSPHVPKLRYHSRGSLALLPKGSRAPVFLALSADESDVSRRSLRTYCSVLLRPSLAPLARAATSLALFLSLPTALLHLSSIDPRLATRPRTPSLLGAPRTWGRSVAAGFRLRHAPALTNLPFLRTYRQIILHDVLVVFHETFARDRRAHGRCSRPAIQIPLRIHARFGLLCTCAHAALGTSVRLRWSDVQTRWRMLGIELSGPRDALFS